jgi:hypothetical protein
MFLLAALANYNLLARLRLAELFWSWEKIFSVPVFFGLPIVFGPR